MSSSDQNDPSTDKSLIQIERSDSCAPSLVSMKTNQSMGNPMAFREGMSSLPSLIQTKRPDAEPSFASMSGQSMGNPMAFREGMSSLEPRVEQHSSKPSTSAHLDSAFKMQISNILDTGQITLYQQSLKSKLLETFQLLHEGFQLQGYKTSLTEIFTDLYITEGEVGEYSNQHEVNHIEEPYRKSAIHKTSIKCNDIFKPLPGQDKPIRTVLTSGIAGIGKTVSVQKFIVDWTEGKANQDIDFIFPLPFRELNFMNEKNISLINLLNCFFPETKNYNTLDYNFFKVLFIFDGLDECRHPLDFQNNKTLSSLRESASLDVVLTNLLKGNLLPSALFWITSRPAAASQIPMRCVDRVTEIQGFSDPQKEEYFRKRITDESLANKIIAHIKSSRSLYIMCHIPVFSWISAAVLERMSETEIKEIPKTLTQMFTHFLILQSRLWSQKYNDVDPLQLQQHILALGKLAFHQLEKGNLIFYEEDLRKCGIDVKEASVYSGICTQIFKEEVGLYMGKMYSFVHLSVQEHLAAVYAFHSFINRNISKQHSSGLFDLFKKTNMFDFLRSAVDMALQSKNGHLDIFLRFLLGLTLESSQTLLQVLLKQTRNSSHCKDDIIEYIKEKIHENPSPEKAINLFHCLNELNDHSLVKKVQTYLNKQQHHRLHGVSLSPAQWTALVFVILNSEDKLEEFNLWKYDASENCLRNLLPVVKASRIADLRDGNLTQEICEALASVLCLKSSCVRELDLSNNKLQDAGVKLLSDGLKKPGCKMEILRLGECSLTEMSCEALASVLSSKSSCLKELRLSHNKLMDSGAKLLSEALKNPQCKLETLRLNKCNITEEGCTALFMALKSNFSHLKWLDLGRNKIGESGEQDLSAVVEDPQCRLEKLKLFDCSITEQGCESLVLALRKNPSHLRELDLGWNKLGDSGVKHISALLNNPQCELEILKLHECDITEEGCDALAKALESNLSHLKELDLSENKLREEIQMKFEALKESKNNSLCKLVI